MSARRAVLSGTILVFVLLLAVSCSGRGRARAPGPPPPPAQTGETPRTLEIPGPDDPRSGPGIWHVVRRGETLWRICRTYGVALERVVAVNRIADAAAIEVGQKIFIPGARERREVPTAPPPSTPSAGGWRWPAEGPVTSRFGAPRGSHKHKGIDIDTEKGQEVRAARAGRVVFAGKRGDYGLLVILEHEEGFSSWYAHNSRILVKGGERVREGQVVARSGRTGRASGTHLHFEIRHRGKPLDPLTFLP